MPLRENDWRNLPSLGGIPRGGDIGAWSQMSEGTSEWEDGYIVQCVQLQSRGERFEDITHFEQFIGYVWSNQISFLCFRQPDLLTNTNDSLVRQKDPGKRVEEWKIISFLKASYIDQEKS